MGSSMGGMTMFSNGVDDFSRGGGYKQMSPLFIPYSVTNMGAALLASHWNLTGPAYSISTACSTGNSCLYAAANHIKEGEVEVMLAGGTDSPILPCVIGGFSACRALSQRNGDPQRASRPWDKERDGFVLGEGSAALVITTTLSITCWIKYMFLKMN